jgi:hypothetical protein
VPDEIVAATLKETAEIQTAIATGIVLFMALIRWEYGDRRYWTLVQYTPPEEIPYPLRRVVNATCVSSEVFDLKPTLGDQNPKFQVPNPNQHPNSNPQ